MILVFTFIPEHGKGENPMPIILNHGYPDSFSRPWANWQGERVAVCDAVGLRSISVNLFVDLRGLITLNPVCGER